MPRINIPNQTNSNDGSDDWFSFATMMTNTLPSVSSLDLYIPENDDAQRVLKGLDSFDKMMDEDCSDDDDDDDDDDLSYCFSLSKTNVESSSATSETSSTSSSSSSSWSPSFFRDHRKKTSLQRYPRERTRQSSRRPIRQKRSVSFSTIEIREYGLVVGDHPFCRDGLSMSLDWKYNQETTIVDIDSYENQHHNGDTIDEGQVYNYFAMKQITKHHPWETNNSSSSSKSNNRSPPEPLNYFERKNRLKLVSGLDDMELLGIQSQIFMERQKNCWYRDGGDNDDDICSNDDGSDDDDDFSIVEEKEYKKKSSSSQVAPPLLEILYESHKYGMRKRH